MYWKKKFHITGFATGLYIAGPVFAMALTSYLVGTVMQKQLSKLLKPGLFGRSNFTDHSFGSVCFFQAKYFLFLSVVVMGVGSGILLPAINTLITSAAQQERGVVTAFYGTVRFFGAALGPPAVGLGLALGSKNMFLIAAVMTAVTAAAGIFFLNPAKMLPAEMRSTKKGKQGQDRAVEKEILIVARKSKEGIGMAKKEK
jgi:ACDE family multidrug resistance protein